MPPITLSQASQRTQYPSDEPSTAPVSLVITTSISPVATTWGFLLHQQTFAFTIPWIFSTQHPCEPCTKFFVWETLNRHS